MDTQNTYIKSISIQKLYGKYNFEWKLNKDVNILVGINGSGKTTVFNIIDYLFTGNLKKLKQYNLSNVKIVMDVLSEKEEYVVSYSSSEKNNTIFHILPIKNMYSKINTFDVPSIARGKDKTLLDDKLEKLLFKKENENTFTFLDYRLTYLANQHNDSTKFEKYKRKIDNFFDLVNQFFVDTNKQIIIDEKQNNVIFVNRNLDNKISTNQLSAGEKQLLIILFSVFLQDENPSILIMDEPEISLHVSWQDKLIDTLRILNPNVQLILSTHSPSVFGQGWGNCIFKAENLFSSND